MKYLKSNKAKLTATTTIVLLMISVLALMINAPVQAQGTDEPVSGPLPDGATPEVIESTRAFLSFRPNPVGVNQIVLVNLWLNPAVHQSRYHPDYEVIITDPDGNAESTFIDSYQADTTAWFEFSPDQVGEWTLQFVFHGTYFPGGDVPAVSAKAPQFTLAQHIMNPAKLKNNHSQYRKT